jgi:hypothetical protein
MLRLESDSGWLLVTHPDHARLAGAFAERWGNDRFLPPEPRAHVLKGISCHDDGWAARDAAPQITRQGKPSAFSIELVGKYSAFEEIDLEDYLAVRECAVRLIATEDPYAAVLISMHTYSLLNDHADRSTIAPSQLPLLDAFLLQQKGLQQALMKEIAADVQYTPEQASEAAVVDNFRLLQATDNLSLLTCVDFRRPAHLLHSLPLNDGGSSRVQVRATAPRHFVLEPYPFAEPSLDFLFPARQVEGKVFESAEELQRRFAEASVQMLSVTVSAE